METLFTTQLKSEYQDTNYHVSFHDDAYHFSPAEGSAAGFALKREHDEWHVVNGTQSEITRNGVAALEAYLLSQH